MTIEQLHRIKKWHVAHRRDHPFEYHLWDLVLTCWVMSWVGCLPAFALHSEWAVVLCALGTFAPGAYVAWRARAHRERRLRCDWLPALGR